MLVVVVVIVVYGCANVRDGKRHRKRSRSWRMRYCVTIVPGEATLPESVPVTAGSVNTSTNTPAWTAITTTRGRGQGISVTSKKWTRERWRAY